MIWAYRVADVDTFQRQTRLTKLAAVERKGSASVTNGCVLSHIFNASSNIASHLVGQILGHFSFRKFSTRNKYNHSHRIWFR